VQIAYGPADATAIPKPHRLLPHLNSDWFYLSRTAYLSCPGKTAVKRVSQCSNVASFHAVIRKSVFDNVIVINLVACNSSARVCEFLPCGGQSHNILIR